MNLLGKVLLVLAISLFVSSIAWATIDFDGTNDALESSGTTPSLNIGTNFTVALWFKSDGTGQSQKYLCSYEAKTGGSEQWAVIYEYVDDKVEFFTNNHTGTAPRTGSQITIADTNWHHIAYVYDGTEWAYWLDGVQTVINANITFNPNAGADLSFHIGQSRANGNVVDANITDFYVWDSALSDQEVVILANSRVKSIGFQLATANIQGAWLLDDISDGTTVTASHTFVDLSGNGNDLIGDISGTSALVARAEAVLSYP